MPKIVTPDQAVAQIRDGATVCLNAFLMLSNPVAIHDAIYRSFTETGSPKQLTLIAPSGCGAYNDHDFCEPYMRAGAVRRLFCSHFNSMHHTMKMIGANELESYCLPMGSMYQTIRAMAAGQPWYLSKVGLGIYVDPRVEGAGMNERSTDQWVDVVNVQGEEFLSYRLPKIDVTVIKATTADPNGNITGEHEFTVGEPLAMARCAHNNGGIVIVEVDRLSNEYADPRTVMVPGALVDYIVPAAPAEPHPIADVMNGAYHAPDSQQYYYMQSLAGQSVRKDRGADQSTDIVCRRAMQEMHPGDIVNIGAGIPETVGKHAAEHNMVRDLTLTVEAGGTGGVPASGRVFGATIGPDMLTTSTAQFDFYDGGGLDIAFMGGLEVDRFGNVNVHHRPDKIPGLGGFANVTRCTKRIVFCVTLCTKNMVVREKDGKVVIEQEGKIRKFTRDVASISFSGQQALKNGQKVLYVTERCVFQLTEKGLKIVEVYPGIDKQKDIIDLLPFELAE